jgi:hypothetical protein
MKKIWLLIFFVLSVNIFLAGAQTKTNEEKNIAEAVLRFEMGTTFENTYFLSILSFDPEDDLMERISKDYPFAKKKSQCIFTDSSVVDKDTGKAGCIITIESIKWIAGSEVEVQVYRFENPMVSERYTCVLKKTEGEWEVIQARINKVS